jgi:hypothetical protein
LLLLILTQHFSKFIGTIKKCRMTTNTPYYNSSLRGKLKENEDAAGTESPGCTI